VVSLLTLGLSRPVANLTFVSPRGIPLAIAAYLLSRSCHMKTVQAATVRVISEGSIRITRAMIEATWQPRNPDRRPIIRDNDCRPAADPASGLPQRAIKPSAEGPPARELALPGSLDYPLGQDFAPDAARATGPAPAQAAAA
jgi:hypothetical protein